VQRLSIDIFIDLSITDGLSLFLSTGCQTGHAEQQGGGDRLH
jgi:hypothetical protein